MINLRYKKLSTGKFSIYLDYTIRGKNGKSHREYEFLKIHVSKDYSHSKRITTGDKPLMELAQSIRSKRELELYGTVKGLNASSKRVNVSLLAFVKKEYIRTNRNSYLAFSKHIEKFSKGKDILFSDVNTFFIEDFAQYLKKLNSHNTVILYLENLKTILNSAIRQEIIAVNPFIRYKIPVKQDTDRTFLELHEVKKLNETPCNCEPQIRQAFLFSCFTGLRLSDITTLKKEHIQIDKDKDGKSFHALVIRPIKTTQTSGQLLKAPLSEQAVKIIKEVKSSSKSDLVFDALPHKQIINNWLKKWAKAAEIKKNLHFHAARHTFATLCLTSGIDIYTVSKLLGHTRIDATQIYAKIIDEKKQKEVKKFPSFMERKKVKKVIK
ncbi:MAG: site-specific integrase [Bacteroidia bacterium]|nr:site-specific integrase [Bacteroidia bacterium]